MIDGKKNTEYFYRQYSVTPHTTLDTAVEKLVQDGQLPHTTQNCNKNKIIHKNKVYCIFTNKILDDGSQILANL